MMTYVSMLTYSAEGVKGISAARTAEAKEAIKRAGGKYIAGYDLLGMYDAMIIAEYPDPKAALKASMELNKLIGVSSRTMLALPINDDDEDVVCLL
ncbi:hypothetical protein U27_04374 [Candidatus Vecturithrix granuli]|uniref:GYD domain-containing protein n=1 Tax=Vecturithrix granuli TaxID=1499967 RepID=A0A081BYK2_VECG1|nr:hypothetical protein U27_04374 [Candidatus Vecturithrix granuli]